MIDFNRLRDAVAVLTGQVKLTDEPTRPKTFSPNDPTVQAQAAMLLRVGLGTLFVIGGLAKLSRLLSPSASDGIVAQYMGSLGYINDTFQNWLFSGMLGEVLSPWTFLTLLSAFELVSGLMLIAGLFVRGLSAFWALLL